MSLDYFSIVYISIIRVAQSETLPIDGNLVFKPICSFSKALGSILGHEDIKNP